MRQPAFPTLLRTIQAQRSLSRRRSFLAQPSRGLWNGTTNPVKNQAIQASIQPSAQEVNKASLAQQSTDAEEISRIHTKFIEDLLSRATSSEENVFSKRSPSGKRQRTKQHSLSEPPLFRTDGPLTPYPVKLDTGEELEPKHATLVKIFDKGGAQRSIVVAEVDDDTGKQRSILLSLDLKEYKDERGSVVGRRISAEEMYATLGLEKS